MLAFHNVKEDHVPDDGIWDTFQRLQDALPDRIGSTSLGASVSVSVN